MTAAFRMGFYAVTLEAISKIGFRFKIKADPRFEPQAYMEYVEDLKLGSNTDIGMEDIF